MFSAMVRDVVRVMIIFCEHNAERKGSAWNKIKSDGKSDVERDCASSGVKSLCWSNAQSYEKNRVQSYVQSDNNRV